MKAIPNTLDSAKQAEVSGLGSSVTSKMSRLQIIRLGHVAIINPQYGFHQLRPMLEVSKLP